MKTSEFVRLLQDADPTGEAEIVVSPVFFGLSGSHPWLAPTVGTREMVGERLSRLHLSFEPNPGSALERKFEAVDAEREACALVALNKAGWCEDFGDLKEDIAARIRARGAS